MYGGQVVTIIQLISVMLAAAVAFGIMLSLMMVRGKLHDIGIEGPLHDIAFTERAYVAAATLCGMGAIASIGVGWGAFAIFVTVGAAFLVADNNLVPPMRQAIAEGRPVPNAGARSRFELIAAICLFFVFWTTAAPPLVMLARVYGIG
jgi:hypothetical protein